MREWFRVEFDDDRIRASAQPPGEPPFEFELSWRDIEKVVFIAEDYLRSDWICLVGCDRDDSYDVPIEADGGLALWEEILNRGLFDRELAGEASRSLGGRFEWPPSKDVARRITSK
jgi:hypothetical protein